MAIARNGSAVVGSGISHAATPSYTVGATSTLVVAVISSTVQPSAVSYGGSAMTLASEEDTVDSTWTTLAYLLNPATGANNFAFTLTTGGITVLAADYSGVNSADGSAVTNFGSGATLTTNVTLAAANEWVVVSGIAGHLANLFQNTTNLTVEQQDDGYLACALMDTNAGVGSGTIGFVTTINSTSQRQGVVLQAFAPASSGTAVAANSTILTELLSTQTTNNNLLLEVSASPQINQPLTLENLGALTSNNTILQEILTSQKTENQIIIELLLQQLNQNPVKLETLGTQQVNNIAWLEVLKNQLSHAAANLEILANTANLTPAQLEFLGSLIVTKNSPLWLEFLASPNRLQFINLETITNLTLSKNLPAENLSRQAANPSLVTESSLTLNVNNNLILENLGTLQVATNNLLPLEFLTAQTINVEVQDAFGTITLVNTPLNLETLADFFHASSLNLELGAGQQLETAVPLEFVGPVAVSFSAQLPLEWGVSIYVAAPLPTEFIGIPVLHPSGAYSIRTPNWQYNLLAPNWRYIYLTPGNAAMPAISSLPPIGLNQQQTMAIDFGNFLPPGVTLVGSPTTNVTVSFGTDPAPNSRILVPATIGTIPTSLGGTGLANTAILWRMGDCLPDVVYIIDLYCLRSDGDTAEASTRFTCFPPT